MADGNVDLLLFWLPKCRFIVRYVLPKCRFIGVCELNGLRKCRFIVILVA